MNTPLPGYATLVIPFPSQGPWLNEGASYDLGRFENGLCSGNLYKTADNQLYVFAEVMTWRDACIKAYIPLRVPAEGEDASILRIRWEDTGVRLQQDAYPPIHAAWQPLR